MYISRPDFTGYVHVALVTGPAQVWYAAAAAAAVGVSADRILFLPDSPNSILLTSIQRIVAALGGVMWSEEASWQWFFRPESTRVMWVNKTGETSYVVNALRRARPGRTVLYADGFIAPMLPSSGLPKWSQIQDSADTDGAFKGFEADIIALSNVFGNFAAFPRQVDTPRFEVPVNAMGTLLERLRKSSSSEQDQGPGLMLATSVHAARFTLLQRHNRIGPDETCDVDGEARLYRALMEGLPRVPGRILCIHPRTEPVRRAALSQIAAETGWRAHDDLSLAEELLTRPGALVVAPPSSIVFTASRICEARCLHIGPELLDHYCGDWWRLTDLGMPAVDLCRSAGIEELASDLSNAETYVRAGWSD